MTKKNDKNSDHIDNLLRDWPFETNSVSVRIIHGDDGRDVLQMRIELGVMQMEITGRPDGQRPGGEESYLDYLLVRTSQDGEDYVLSEEECEQTNREFVQYYHRRICWLALRDYDRARDDADHTLRLMDVCRDHSPDDQWTLSHEQYRPFVMFHRTQAAALAVLDEEGAEAAVERINQGLEKLRGVFVEHDADEHFEDDELVKRLQELRETLRDQFEIGRTLKEQLEDAVATEQYELAAQLRDRLARRDLTGH